MTWFRFVDANAVSTYFEDTNIAYITINNSDLANATAALFQLYIIGRPSPLLLTLVQVEAIVGTPLPNPIL